MSFPFGVLLTITKYEGLSIFLLSMNVACMTYPVLNDNVIGNEYCSLLKELLNVFPGDATEMRQSLLYVPLYI